MSSLSLIWGWAAAVLAATPQPTATIPLRPYLAAQAIVEATVNGRRGLFLFDTGEGVSSISPSFARQIGCKPWGRVTGFRMSGERVDSLHCDNVTVELSGYSAPAPVVLVLDIMALMGPDVPAVDGALGLDLFVGKVVTVIPRQALVVESPQSLAVRIAAGAKALPLRLVRDAEGAALAVDAPVQTPAGTAWMELDSGNGGSLVVANHIAPSLGMAPNLSAPVSFSFSLANGIVVAGPTRTRDLIMDGNIGAVFLNHWVLTMDLEHARGWLSAFHSTVR